jgi:diaminohydroxyphosphoribosylaminopyrimidine deaminase/5-amino-6-(5-phosphoribosylamino)uracil reductase
MGAADDLRYMGLALALARSQLGQTAPNPAVGCVLVSPDGAILATGATADGGRPHAERVALDLAGGTARGATAYVTLEPCAHYGQTPPCAEGLIKAGVRRVVVAVQDRYAEVDGRGIAMLQQAGIPVDVGLLEGQARALYAGFFHRLSTGQPLIHEDGPRKGYDAVLAETPLHALDDRLDTLGKAGASRVRVEPGSAFAHALKAADRLA